MGGAPSSLPVRSESGVESAGMRQWFVELNQFVARRRPALHMAAALLFVMVAPANDKSILLGLPLLLLGIAIRTWALGCIVKDGGVCRAGPYAWVRHPLYLGSLVMALGYCVAVNSPPLAGIVVALAGALYAVAIRREEKALLLRFPEEYHAYIREVPCLIPSLRRNGLRTEGGGFRWHRAVANRAVRATLLSLLALALFDAKEDLVEVVTGWEPTLHPWLAHICPWL